MRTGGEADDCGFQASEHKLCLGVTFSERDPVTFLKFSKPQILQVLAQLPSLGLEFPHQGLKFLLSCKYVNRITFLSIRSHY